VELMKNGYEVRLTRENDIFVELDDRSAKATSADFL
jgi:N-acetylmuramoyl-L-alanine amidase